MAFAAPVSVLASAARTTTGTSPGIILGDAGDVLALAVNVSAVSGTTPTLDLAVQWSHDGTTWFAADVPDTFVQVTAAKQTSKTFVIKGPRYRFSWTIGGTTPSFTFDVSAFSVS